MSMRSSHQLTKEILACKGQSLSSTRRGPGRAGLRSSGSMRRGDGRRGRGILYNESTICLVVACIVQRVSNCISLTYRTTNRNRQSNRGLHRLLVCDRMGPVQAVLPKGGPRKAWTGASEHNAPRATERSSTMVRRSICMAEVSFQS